MEIKINKLATLFIFAEILKIQRDHQTDFVVLLKVEGLKKYLSNGVKRSLWAFH